MTCAQKSRAGNEIGDALSGFARERALIRYIVKKASTGFYCHPWIGFKMGRINCLTPLETTNHQWS